MERVFSRRAKVGFSITVSVVLALMIGATQGLTFDPTTEPPEATPEPADPSDPSPQPTSAAQQPAVDVMVPDEFRGMWVRAETEAYDFTIDGPDAANGLAVAGTAWLRIDDSGRTTEYYGEFTIGGEPHQIVHETTASSVLWAAQPIVPPDVSPQCMLETPTDGRPLEMRFVPFVQPEALVAVGYERLTDTLGLPERAVQELSELEYVDLFGVIGPSRVAVVALDQDGLAVFEYTARMDRGVLIAERYNIIYSVEESSAPDIAIPQECAEAQ